MLRMTALQKQKTGKSIRVNVVINLVRTLTMTILSFITFPYVTRALGDQVFGLYTWANTFVYYFLVLARISIPNIAIRECAKVRNDKEALSHKAQEFFLIQAVTTLLSFALMASLCFTVPSLRENNALIFLLSINFLLGLFSFEWIYIALEKHVYITIRSISLIALSAILTYTFIHKTSSPGNAMNEVYIYALITILPTILTSAINFIFLRRHISFKKTRPYDFKPLIRPLVSLFFISLFVTAYNQTDSFLLGFMDQSKAAVGSYSVGVKGIDIVITLITSLYTVFMPRASKYYEWENKIHYRRLIDYGFHITFVIAIPAVATMAIMSTPIVGLVAGTNVNQYQNAGMVLTILASMMLTFSLCDDIYTQILIPQKKEKHYMYAMLLGVALNIGLSLLFGYVVFKDAPIIGVAIATMIADVVVLAVLIFMAKGDAIHAIFNLDNLKVVLAGIIIGAISYFLYPALFNAFPWKDATGDLWISYLLALLIVVSIDAVVYIGLLFLSRESITRSFIERKGGTDVESELEGE